MIQILFTLSPLLILFLCAILSLGLTQNIKKNQQIGIAGIIFALILNTLQLIYAPDTILFNSLVVNAANLSIIEIILLFGLVIFLSVHTNLKKSHTESFIAPNYLLFLAACIGIFLSNNILIITTFTILGTTSLGILFYFGPYKKITSLHRFFIVIITSATCLLITSFMGYFRFNTFDISIWKLLMPFQQGYIQGLFFILILFGLGMNCGIFPILTLQFDEYFRQSNPVNLRLSTAIFYPIIGLLLAKIMYTLFGYNSILVSIGFFMILFGIIITLGLLLTELFGKNRIQSQSVLKIIGLSSVLDFHVIVFLGFAVKKAAGEYRGDALDAIILLTVLLMAVKCLWIDSFGPIFNSTDDFNLRQIGGFYRYYPKFILFLFIIPVILSFPFLPGTSILTSLIQAFTMSNFQNPINISELWISLIVYILYIGALFVIIASMINEIFFGKSEVTQSEIIPKIESKYYYSPLIVLLFISFLTIREIFGFHFLFPPLAEIRALLFNI